MPAARERGGLQALEVKAQPPWENPNAPRRHRTATGPFCRAGAQAQTDLRVCAAGSSAAHRVQAFAIKTSRLQGGCGLPCSKVRSQLWLRSHGSARGCGSVRDPSGSRCGRVKLHCPQVLAPTGARARASGAQLAGLCGGAALQLWASLT